MRLLLRRPSGFGLPSQRRPLLVQSLALDLPDLALAHAKTLGDQAARLRHADLVVLGLDQGQENLPAAVFREGCFNASGFHVALLGLNQTRPSGGDARRSYHLYSISPCPCKLVLARRRSPRASWS